MTLTKVKGITFPGQRVTVERRPVLGSETPWVVTGWEKGLPVARKPINPDELMSILNRYQHELTF